MENWGEIVLIGFWDWIWGGSSNNDDVEGDRKVKSDPAAVDVNDLLNKNLVVENGVQVKRPSERSFFLLLIWIAASGVGVWLISGTLAKVLLAAMAVAIALWIWIAPGETDDPDIRPPSFSGFAIFAVIVGTLVGGLVWVLGPNLLQNIIASTIVFLVTTTVVIYRYVTSVDKHGSRAVTRHWLAILACFIVLAIVAIVIGIAAFLSFPETFSGYEFLVGFSSSMVEDLVFFALLGAFVVLMQRRETDMKRTMDDRIGLLFNAKKLRSGEAAFLQDRIRSISDDCRESTTFIDVKEYDSSENLVFIDVSRKFYVANYLDDVSCLYDFKIHLEADPQIKKDPAIEVFPALSSQVTKDGEEWRQVGDQQILDDGGLVKTGKIFNAERKNLEIKRGEIREFKTRFEGWQRLFRSPPGSKDQEPDFYEVELLKHWDSIHVKIRNSLKNNLKVTIFDRAPLASKAGKGEAIAKFDLVAGDDVEKAFFVRNLQANTIIAIHFDPA